VLIIAGIVYLVQAINGRNKKTDTNEAPLDILKKRYAKGEVSKEDLDRMKDDLMIS
jgi:putative membrane protein